MTGWAPARAHAAALAPGRRAAAAEGPERRLLAPEEAVAFRGVGRLNVAGTRFCTATLISETVIVTAAHCLFHPRTRAEVPLAEFRFVAGLRMGKSAALRRVVRAVTQPDFAFEGFASPAGVRRRPRAPRARRAGRGRGRGGLPDRRTSPRTQAARHRLLRPRPGAGALDRDALRRRRRLRRGDGARLRGEPTAPPGRRCSRARARTCGWSRWSRPWARCWRARSRSRWRCWSGPWIEPLLAALAAEPREE